MGCLTLIFLIFGTLFFGTSQVITTPQTVIESVEAREVTIFASIPQSRTEDGGFVLGSPDAPITIVVFADFLCPHCQDYESALTPFIEQYVAAGQARLEQRFFPVVDPTFSVLAIQLAECAESIRPGSFWDARAILFDLAAQERFNAGTAAKFAAQIGIDEALLLQCTPTATQVQIDTALARQLNVGGVPSVWMRAADGKIQPIPGPRPTLEQLEILVQGAQR